MQERKNVVLLQLCARVKEVELHHKSKAGDLAAKRFSQLCRSFRSAASGQQVIHNKHALSFFDCVAMDFKSVGAVLERVVIFGGRGGQLSGLADWNESGLPP